jgi:hypothetical protein
MGLLALPILYPYGNLEVIDAYFFGASASTESGLNTYVSRKNSPRVPLCLVADFWHSVDVKELKTYQQLYLYFIPIFTNLGFINMIVVVVRLFWFDRHLKRLGELRLSLTVVCDAMCGPG